MNKLDPITASPSLPTLIADAGETAPLCSLDFFTARMASHASTRTTQLNDRGREELSLDEAEKIRV